MKNFNVQAEETFSKWFNDALDVDLCYSDKSLLKDCILDALSQAYKSGVLDSAKVAEEWMTKEDGYNNAQVESMMFLTKAIRQLNEKK